MNDKPIKKIKVNPVSPADYARYLARIRAEAAERQPPQFQPQPLLPEIGHVMKDGTVFAGISPDTNRPMYAAPVDAPLSMTFNQAAEYAKKLEEIHGPDSWRVPTKAELNVLFQNREKGALKGTFNLIVSDIASYYWSSAPSNSVAAWSQRFSDGMQGCDGRYYGFSVRCVRS